MAGINPGARRYRKDFGATESVLCFCETITSWRHQVAKLTPKQDQKAVELINAIESLSKTVHTQSLDISFDQLWDVSKNEELNISPDFQRLFRWSEGARSRFIESLLLEMPVPPIYVIEEDEGKYILIDGLQRISSYLHLRGELNAGHLDPPVSYGQKLAFTDCDIVEELNGKTFDDLGTALQIRLKRAFVRVEVVRKESDSRFKYHMFKRLNTGGQLFKYLDKSLLTRLGCGPRSTTRKVK